jgi:hypothetical protein
LKCQNGAQQRLNLGADFWLEMPVATATGLATLASGWSSYQSALRSGIQIIRFVDAADFDL